MQNLQVLIIGDPIFSLKPASDTSLALAEETLSRGGRVFWCTPDTLWLESSPVNVHGLCNEITSASATQVEASDRLEARALDSFDCVWIRKDPPFDSVYWTWCGWLSLIENRVRIENRPSLFLQHHEKLLPFFGVVKGYFDSEDLIETSVILSQASFSQIKVASHERIQKPWLGHGGRGVEVLNAKGLSQKLEEPAMIQPLVEGIRTMGDRRVFILDGEIRGSFVRLPPEGSVKSNLASGGTAVLREMSAEEQSRAVKVAKLAKDLGFLFVGLDLLGGKISEINFTSPTGVRMLKKLVSVDLASEYLDLIENGVKVRG